MHCKESARVLGECAGLSSTLALLLPGALLLEIIPTINRELNWIELNWLLECKPVSGETVTICLQVIPCNDVCIDIYIYSSRI